MCRGSSDRRKKKGLIERLEANLLAALAAQAASAPSTPALASSWRPLSISTVGAESRSPDDPIVEDTGEEDAVAARSTAGQPSGEAESGYDEDSGPRWPDEAEESSALAERGAPNTIREQIDHAAAIERAEKEDAVRDLPPLDELIERISPELREGLENLFRLKYTKVRRLPKRLFSTPPAEN